MSNEMMRDVVLPGVSGLLLMCVGVAMLCNMAVQAVRYVKTMEQHRLRIDNDIERMVRSLDDLRAMSCKVNRPGKKRDSLRRLPPLAEPLPPTRCSRTEYNYL